MYMYILHTTETVVATVDRLAVRWVGPAPTLPPGVRLVAAGVSTPVDL